MDRNELYHYGVLGMKWGVRRNRSTNSGTGKKSRKQIRDSKEENKLNPTRNMSDTELRQRINRLQMEKQYVQLTAKQTSFGKKFVTDILTNAAKQTATNYVSKYMTKGVDLGIDALIKRVNG